MKKKMNLRMGLSATLAMTFVAPMLAPMAAFANTGITTIKVKEQGSQLALDQSTLTMLSLVLAVAKVEQNAGGLVAVDPAVAAKYEMIRKAYLGSVPTTAITGLAVGLGGESVRRVEFVLKPLTLLLRGSQKLSVMTLNGVEAFSQATGLDKVMNAAFDSSGKTLQSSYDNIIEPMVKIFVTRNTSLSSGTSSASAIGAGSLFFMMNDSKEAMTKETVRNILGQNDIVRSRVEAAVSGIAQIYSLSTEQQARLKVAIYDNVIKQAVENNFSEDMTKYNLDITSLMVEKQIIDKSEIAAITKVRSIALKLTRTSESDESIKQLATENTEMALALAALLESQLSNSKLDGANRAEVERMLGSVVSKLTLVGFNINR
jgi:hypothetical protein